MNFSYCNTTKVYFSNEIVELFNYVCESHYKKILLITGGKFTKKIADKISDVFAANHVEFIILDGVTTNPLAETIKEMTAKAKVFMPDVIITVGGGSVHDAGKIVSFMYYSEESIVDYTVDGRLGVPGIVNSIPVITVPTIFGSGAEVSPAALVRINNEKKVIFSPLLHPVASFINISFAKSLTCYQIARSSFDSFIQALEGYISKLSNNISCAFATIVIKNYNIALPYLFSSQICDDVLEKLAISSVFSSYVCSTASVGAIHAISDPISGRYNTHHATALALVAEDVLKKNLSVVDAIKIRELDDMLTNVPTEFVDSADRLIDKIVYIIDHLDLIDNVEKNIEKKVIMHMAEEAFNGDMVGNPYDFKKSEIIDILRKHCND